MEKEQPIGGNKAAGITIKGVVLQGTQLIGNIQNNGKYYECMLDTGANISMMPDSLATPIKQQALVKLADNSERWMPVGEFRGRKVILNDQLVISLKDHDWIVPYETKWMKQIDWHVAISEILGRTNIKNKAKLEEILNKASKAGFKNDVGLMANHPYHIQGGLPSKQKQYPLGKAEKEFKEIVKELEQLDVIGKIDNPPCIMPVQAVLKKDGTVRAVHNLKDLNDVTVKDTRQIVNPREAMMALRPKAFNSTIDLANGFWSVPLTEASMHKTCFMVDGQAYFWKRLPMGFCNSANAFQERIVKVLEGLPVVVYIDDIFLSTKTEDEHLDLLERVLDKLREAGLKIRIQKCEFGVTNVKYLGMMVGEKVVQMVDGYLDDLCPTTIKELESALGKTGWLRSAIPDYPVLARPAEEIKLGLRKWDCDKQKLVEFNRSLNSEEIAVWEDVLGKLKASVRQLSPFFGSEKLVLDTYVHELGGWVSVSEEGQKLPFVYFSHRFSNTEHRYSDIEKELTILWKAYKEIRNLAAGKKVIVRTENPMTKEMHKQTVEFAKAYQSRWGKWAMMIQDLDWTFQIIGNKLPKDRPQKNPKWDGKVVIYTDGSMTNKDKMAKWGFIVVINGKRAFAQTRLEGTTAQEAEILAAMNALKYAKKKKFRNLKLVSDSWYVVQGIRENLKFWKVREYQNYKGQTLEHADYWKVIAQLVANREIIVEHIHSHTKEQTEDHQGNREVDKLVQARGIKVGKLMVPSAWADLTGIMTIPVDEAPEYLKEIHSMLFHPGIDRQKKWMSENKITTQNVHEAIKKIRQNCPSCAQKGNLPPIAYSEQKIAIDTPGVSASMDVGHLSEGSYRKFLVIADNAGGNTKIYPIKREVTYEAEKALLNYLESNSTLKEVRSDNATMFTSGRFATFLEELGIKHTFSIPYQSNTNGVAERAVRSAKEQIVLYKNKWWQPQSLYEINKYLSQPKIRKSVDLPANDSSLSLQEGDEVWLQGTDEFKIVDKVEGNVVHTKDGNRFHPKQLRVKRLAPRGGD